MGEIKNADSDGASCEGGKRSQDAARPYFAKRRPDWEPQQLHHGLQLASFASLKDQSRLKCPVCGKSRCWYCADCVCSLFPDEQPSVALPFNVRIITHPEEKRSKSTGLQAKLLCPNAVELIDFEEVSAEALSPATAALLFPSTEAVCPEGLDITDIKTIYIIDRCAHRCSTAFHVSSGTHTPGMLDRLSTRLPV